MYERTIKYQDGGSSGFSTTGTIEESLELLLEYVKTHGGISEVGIKQVLRPTYSSKDMRSLSGIASYT